ncbi:hypothetical protein [Dysgonomonas sp. ZJ709]|uniref:hypothetical protein n=1 Tax=Dysgonomonas sp. ZJ709 TaxID=2709797 RepID=UPI0013EB7314|nr:hypothetical protein [Dysgonomonas sp. ZJ709]
MDAFAHANAILLGGALSDHYQVDERNYNLASGFSVKTGINIAYTDRFSVSSTYEMYRMFTWRGYPDDINWDDFDSKTLNAQGDRSQAVLHVTSLQTELKLKKQWYLTGMFINYTRDTNYKKFEDVFSKTSEGRLMLTYKF